MVIDIMGWVAVLLLVPAAWLQFFKNHKRKSTEGISMWMFWLLFLGLGMLFIVSVAESSPIVIILNFLLSSLGNGAVIVQYFIYEKRKKH